MAKYILFWRIVNKETGERYEYGAFSNFARYPFTVSGVKYQTSEHYFQSKKFLDEKNAEDVIRAPDPKTAAAIGRDRSRPLRKDWENVKLDVMREALRYKFCNYSTLVKKLLETEDAILVEDSPIDYFWGWGKDHSGQNMLGKLLMELREELKQGNISFDQYKEPSLKGGL